jgi:hypothetical protein
MLWGSAIKWPTQLRLSGCSLTGSALGASGGATGGQLFVRVRMGQDLVVHAILRG